MTKKTNFDDDVLIDQPDIGGYYYGNMFRFPEEELMRPQYPAMKKTPAPKEPKPTQDYMPSDMPGTMNEESMLQPTLTNIGYTQAYLRTLIGRRVRVSFLIGTSMLMDRVGTIVEVGISYIVLKQLDANINIMCDLYSIKFVDIYNA
jgi:hypothetical protein